MKYLFKATIEVEDEHAAYAFDRMNMTLERLGVAIKDRGDTLIELPPQTITEADREAYVKRSQAAR